MPAAGQHHTLPIVKYAPQGAYLDGGAAGEILLPKRAVPEGAAVGDDVEVFLYHDSESRLIATTDKPSATVGEIAAMAVVAVTRQGAFLDWGLMKDLFVPLSGLLSRPVVGESLLVYVFLDERTGRVAATEKFAKYLQSDTSAVPLNRPLPVTVWAETDLGYRVIVDNQYTGLLHHGDVFRHLEPGDRFTGYVKSIRPDGKLDVVAGERGFGRVSGAEEVVLTKLAEAGGYLPYNDKSEPDAIYEAFGISKKVFKMATGGLYRKGLIQLTKAGIQQADVHPPAEE